MKTTTVHRAAVEAREDERIRGGVMGSEAIRGGHSECQRVRGTEPTHGLPAHRRATGEGGQVRDRLRLRAEEPSRADWTANRAVAERSAEGADLCPLSNPGNALKEAASPDIGHASLAVIRLRCAAAFGSLASTAFLCSGATAFDPRLALSL